MLTIFYRLTLFSGLLFGQAAAFAESLGDVSLRAIGPVNALRQGLSSMAVIVGIFFIFLAFARYMRYRVNPQEQPLSNVVVYFLLGLALIGLAILYRWAILADVAFGMKDVTP